MDSTRFDELTKALATPTSRRQTLHRIGGALAGGLLATLLPEGVLAKGGGNSACAHFCAEVFGADTPAADQCTSDAAHHKGLCYTCGPASSGGGVASSICCSRNGSGYCSSYSSAHCPCDTSQCLTCQNSTCVSTCRSDQACSNGTCGCAPGTVTCGSVCCSDCCNGTQQTSCFNPNGSHCCPAGNTCGTYDACCTSDADCTLGRSCMDGCCLGEPDY